MFHRASEFPGALAEIHLTICILFVHINTLVLVFTAQRCAAQAQQDSGTRFAITAKPAIPAMLRCLVVTLIELVPIERREKSRMSQSLLCNVRHPQHTSPSGNALHEDCVRNILCYSISLNGTERALRMLVRQLTSAGACRIQWPWGGASYRHPQPLMSLQQ